MSKLNKRMVMRRIVFKNIRKSIGVCAIAMLVTTLAATNSKHQEIPENDVTETIEVEEVSKPIPVAGVSAEVFNILTLDKAEVVERPMILVASAQVVNEDSILNVNTESEEEIDVQEATEVEVISTDEEPQEIIEESTAEEETIEEEEIVTTISEYWPVTEDQMSTYFGYVPESWELAYWEATIMAEARGEPEEGIKAVADCIGYVRTNTDDRFPNTIYGVITEKNQFSTWKSGAVEKWLGNISDDVHEICVNQIQNGASYDAAFFTAGGYNKYCKPGFVIGNHYFGY